MSDLMTTTALKKEAATRYSVRTREVEVCEAPNGGYVLFHHLIDGTAGGEDFFGLVWQQANGNVIWAEYDPYWYTADTVTVETQAGF